MAIDSKIFFVGGTGNTGVPAVNALLDKGVGVTLYTRNAENAKKAFPADKHALIATVQGDLSDTAALREAIKGHTRLFLNVPPGGKDMVKLRVEIAKTAYEAGIKQIVNISAGLNAFGDWRSSDIVYGHYRSEQLIAEQIDRPDDTYFVAIRPYSFMSNYLGPFHLAEDGAIVDIVPSDVTRAVISPRDVGEVAANLLLDDMEKHGDTAYDLVGDVVTGKDRQAIYERLLGKPIGYKVISPQEKFDRVHAQLAGFAPYRFIMDLAAQIDPSSIAITPKLHILLGRNPETFEEYLTANKDAFVQKYGFIQ